tara:strand:+ start:30 stop:257 length:228 start_codon:yes stop_codon:yes gene_type:complete
MNDVILIRDVVDEVRLNLGKDTLFAVLKKHWPDITPKQGFDEPEVVLTPQFKEVGGEQVMVGIQVSVRSTKQRIL